MIKSDYIHYKRLFLVMRRKKAVEGIVVDLMGEEEVECDIDALLASSVVATIVEEEEPAGSKGTVVPKGFFSQGPSYYLNLFDKLNHGICGKCNKEMYGYCKTWKGVQVCGYCHTHMRDTDVSDSFKEYLSAVYGTGCSFCGQTKGRFHLDHKNMFNKAESICDMLDRGFSEEAIREEIMKCQLLCITCHSVVTRYEQHAGFHKCKATLTRLKAKYGEDNDIYIQRHAFLYAKYEEIMAAIYPRIRALGCPVGEPLR